MSRRKHLMKRGTLIALSVVGYVLMLPVWTARRRSRGGEFRVLTYHSINPDRRHETNVKPEDFERQMAFLARYARVRDLRDLLRPGKPHPAGGTNPVVAITLDDGYADNVLFALPILRRHGLCAACFAVASLVDMTETLAHDRAETPAAARLLSRDEIRRWVKDGMAVGSHLMHHARASRMLDDELKRELKESKLALERCADTPVELVSFPFGRVSDMDDRAPEAARAEGYLGAATAMYGWNRPGGDPFAVRRIGIESSDTLWILRAKLNGALDLLALLETVGARRLVRRMNRLEGDGDVEGGPAK